MRKQTVVLWPRTGDPQGRVRLLRDAGLACRAEDLKRALPAAGRILAQFAALACDGCEAVIQMDPASPVLPPGWVSRDTGDFCPACQ